MDNCQAGDELLEPGGEVGYHQLPVGQPPAIPPQAAIGLNAPGCQPSTSLPGQIAKRSVEQQTVVLITS